MTQPRKPVLVAINVMRARLTVVGFNLAIVTFQLGAVPRLPGAVPLPELGRSVHLATDVTLLIGLAVSTVAMVCFILSSVLDEQGCCDHWSLLVGDILMFLGLAQSISGFFQPYMAVLDALAPAPPGTTASLTTIQAAALMSGGVAWLSATYLGPVISLLRSPFSRAATLAAGGAYLLLLLGLAQVGVEAMRFEAAHRDGDTTSFSILGELVQPLRW